MAKILIVSDSHGLTDELVELKKRHPEMDLYLHCGDSELMYTDEAIAGFVSVRGNCDYESSFRHDEVLEIDGMRILLTHGHLYQVKSTLMNLKLRAEETKADIVCFGHSHLLGVEQINETLFLNPGSLRLPRRRMERTYCILETRDKQVHYKVFDYDQGEIVELQQTFSFHK